MVGKHPSGLRLRILSTISVVVFPIIPSGHTVAAQSDFMAFYPTAEARTQLPPDLATLSILCSQKSEGGYTTFVGGPNSKVLLVVFTEKRVKDLSKVITLKIRFTRGSQERGEMPSPTARVGPEATLDWAYVYDRNGDGRVDYVAFLFAAIPVKPDDFPTDYPKGARVGSWEHYKLMIERSRLTFSHHADDNFDGSSDALVAVVRDPERLLWVEQFGVLRSSQYDGNVDETWTFKKSIDQRTGTVVQSDGRYVLQQTDAGELRTGTEWLAFGTKLMRLINDHAQECRLAKDSFLQE